jgi:hypothetical protein
VTDRKFEKEKKGENCPEGFCLQGRKKTLSLFFFKV